MVIEENISTDTNQDKENEVIAKPVSEETTLPINPPKEKELSIEKNEEPKAEVETKQEIKHIDNNSDNTVVPSQENKETATSSDVVTKDSTTSEEAPKNKEIKSSDEAKPQTTTETKSQKVTTSNSKMLKPELLKEQFKEKMASKSLPEEKTNNNAINIEVKVIDKELDRSQDI